jgi:hypothetical protein
MYEVFSFPNIPQVDTDFEITIPGNQSPEDFVNQQTGEMRSRLRYLRPNRPGTWNIQLDQTVWEID